MKKQFEINISFFPPLNHKRLYKGLHPLSIPKTEINNFLSNKNKKIILKKNYIF